MGAGKVLLLIFLVLNVETKVISKGKEVDTTSLFLLYDLKGQISFVPTSLIYMYFQHQYITVDTCVH